MEGQLSLFDMGVEEQAIAEPVLQDVKDYSRMQRLEYEQELLGMYVTGHPLDDYAEQLRRGQYLRSDELNAQASASDELDGLSDLPADLTQQTVQDKQLVHMAGMLITRRNQTTRKGELMSFLTMEDIAGRFEVIVFPRTLVEAGELIREGRVLAIRGRVSMRDSEENQLIADSFQVLEADQERAPAGREPEPSPPPRVNAATPVWSPAPEIVEESDRQDATVTHRIYIRLPQARFSHAEGRLQGAREIYPGELALILVDPSEEALPRQELRGFGYDPAFLDYLVEMFGLENLWIGSD